MTALLLVCALGLGRLATPPEPVQAEAPPPPARGGRGKPVVFATALTGAAGLFASPAVRKAVGSTVRKLLDRDDLRFDEGPAQQAETEVEAAAPTAPPAPTPVATAPAPPAELNTQSDDEKFALTPERLTAIASLNPQLAKVSDQLAAVPVFTAAVGNGTSPLTVPGEDGTKLAYFFTESADAEAFLAAVTPWFPSADFAMLRPAAARVLLPNVHPTRLPAGCAGGGAHRRED